jgi:uncharacterized protein
MKIDRIFAVVISPATAVFLILSLATSVPAQDTNLDFQATQAGADKGDAKAQYDLARCYERGIGVRHDELKAAQYARLAANQGYAPGEVLLGSYYGRGIGIGSDIKMAVQWYRKAADQGNAVAQYAMGGFYATGRGVTNDPDQAIQWWQKAAAQNHMEAEARLGELHLVATVPFGPKYIDQAQAVIFLRRAAAQGSAAAMNNLGVAYEHGFGVKHDLKEAVKWYKAAANRGDAMAQDNLGRLYDSGTGVPQDRVEAYKWLKLSTLGGNYLGRQDFDYYETQNLLTPKQTADAEQLVKSFQLQTGGVQN